nr:hypothetical protein Iba_chr12aCG5040 [Ipomoea batatas]
MPRGPPILITTNAQIKLRVKVGMAVNAEGATGITRLASLALLFRVRLATGLHWPRAEKGTDTRGTDWISGIETLIESRDKSVVDDAAVESTPWTSDCVAAAVRTCGRAAETCGIGATSGGAVADRAATFAVAVADWPATSAGAVADWAATSAEAGADLSATSVSAGADWLATSVGACADWAVTAVGAGADWEATAEAAGAASVVRGSAKVCVGGADCSGSSTADSGKFQGTSEHSFANSIILRESFIVKSSIREGLRANVRAIFAQAAGLKSEIP